MISLGTTFAWITICKLGYAHSKKTVTTSFLPGRPRGLERQRSKPNYLRKKPSSCKNKTRIMRYKPHHTKKINQSINQSINRPINQSTKQSNFCFNDWKRKRNFLLCLFLACCNNLSKVLLCTCKIYRCCAFVKVNPLVCKLGSNLGARFTKENGVLR